MQNKLLKRTLSLVLSSVLAFSPVANTGVFAAEMTSEVSADEQSEVARAESEAAAKAESERQSEAARAESEAAAKAESERQSEAARAESEAAAKAESERQSEAARAESEAAAKAESERQSEAARAESEVAAKAESERQSEAARAESEAAAKAESERQSEAARTESEAAAKAESERQSEAARAESEAAAKAESERQSEAARQETNTPVEIQETQTEAPIAEPETQIPEVLDSGSYKGFWRCTDIQMPDGSVQTEWNNKKALDTVQVELMMAEDYPELAEDTAVYLCDGDILIGTWEVQENGAVFSAGAEELLFYLQDDYLMLDDHKMIFRMEKEKSGHLTLTADAVNLKLGSEYIPSEDNLGYHEDDYETELLSSDYIPDQCGNYHTLYRVKERSSGASFLVNRSINVQEPEETAVNNSTEASSSGNEEETGSDSDDPDPAPVTEAYETELEQDGLPMQGSIVQVETLKIPFDTWDFNPFTDFTNIVYDLGEFEITYISDDIDYETPGTYSTIYRVNQINTERMWFVLRPVQVAEEGETVEVTDEPETNSEVESQSESETEDEPETSSEELTEAGTETESEISLETETETETGLETEMETETEIETETEMETEDETEYIEVEQEGIYNVHTLSSEDIMLQVSAREAQSGEIVQFIAAPMTEEDFFLSVSSVNYDSDGIPYPGTVQEAFAPAAEEEGVYEFTMPAHDVVITAITDSATRALVDYTGISLMADDNDVADQTKFIEVRVEGTRSYTPSTWLLYPGQWLGSTNSKVVKYTFKDGSTGKNIAYCLQANKKDPNTGVKKIEDLTNITNSSNTRYQHVAILAYYLYGGPGWGKDVDIVNEKGKVETINFKEMLMDMGCTTDSHFQAASHYILAYAYNPSDVGGYNYGYNASLTGWKQGIFKQSVLDFFKECDEYAGYMSMKDVKITIKPGKLSSSIKNGTLVSKSFSVTGPADNKLTTTLKDGLTLVNETTGNKVSGDGKTIYLTTGDADAPNVYHFESSDLAGLSGSTTEFVWQSKYSVDYSAYIDPAAGDSQDLYLYLHTGATELPLTIEWKEVPPASFKIYKVDEETQKFDIRLKGVKFNVYSNSGCTKLLETITIGSTGVGISESSYYVDDVVYIKEAPGQTIEGYGYNKSKYKVTITSSTGDTSVTIPNPVSPVSFKIYKVSAEDGKFHSSMIGAKYNVFGDSKCTDLLETVTIGKNGYGVTSENYYLDDVVYVREDPNNVISGFSISNKKTKVKITSTTDPIEVTVEEPTTRQVKVKKVSSDPTITDGNGMYDLTGATFWIYSDKACTNRVGDYSLTVKKNGLTDPVELEKGTYYLKEQAPAPKGYKLNETPVKFVLNDDSPEVTTVEIADEPIVGKISGELVKEAAAATTRSLEGAQFRVNHYADSSTSKVLRSWVFATKTDSDGKTKISFEDARNKVSGDDLYTINGEVKYPLGYYTIQEIKAPEGYLINEEVFTRTLAADHLDGSGEAIPHEGTTELKIIEEPEYGGVKFNKFSLDMGKGNGSSGNGTLAGAVYAVVNLNDFTVSSKNNVDISYAKNEEVTRVTTDASGHGEIGAILQAGTYRLKEVTPSNGYLLNTGYKDFTITNDGEIVDLTVETGDPFAETEIRGGFTIQKVDSETGLPVPQGNAALAGAEFAITNKSANAVKVNGVVYQPNEVVLTIRTNDAGIAETGRNVLPYGTYEVREVTAPVGYALNTQVIPVTIDADGEYDLLKNAAGHDWEDTVIRGGFTIQKVDSETGLPVPQGNASLAGAEFTVTNKNARAVKVNGVTYQPNEAVLTIRTNESGLAETGRKALPYGTYEVREVTPPVGYALNTQAVQVTIGTEDQYGLLKNAAGHDWEDAVHRGGFKVSKWDMEQDAPDQTQGDASLAGAEFTLKNVSANTVMVDVDGNGTFEAEESFAAGAVIAVLKTDEDGNIAVPANYLPYGTYNLTETKPPQGYTPEGENLSRTFQITKDGELLDYTTEDSATKNRVIRGDISILKFRDTLSSEEPTDDVEPMEGVKFEVRLKSTGELFATLVTDERGFATTVDKENYPDGRLPYGLYLITETEHPDDVTAVKPFEVMVDTDHKDYNKIYKNDHPIEMPITLKKVDAESGLIIPIAGTEFQILDAEKEVITFDLHYPHKETITNFVTDESGTITLPEKLPYGTYYIHEVNAPSDYLRGNDLEMKVTEWGSWDEDLIIEYPDSPAKGRIRVTKYDADTDEKIAGAVFAVFANEEIATGDGMIHHNKGDFVGTFAVGEDGIGESDDLYLGKYYVQEIKAPEGYCLDEKRYDFELVYADQETPVVYVDMDNYNKPTTLKLYKTDTDEETLAGVTFRIERLGGQEGSGIENPDAISNGTFVTDEEGLIIAKYLRSGIYSVEEIAALPGYVLDSVARYVTVDANGYIFESDITGKALDEDKAKSNVETLSWINEYTKWDFSKEDVTGDKELPGASLEIYDSEGELVAEWTSTEETHRINKLPVGSYTLVEKTAPEGYVKATSVPFEVTETAAVQKAVMVDKRVAVNKYDETLETYVAGAVLEIRDEADEVIDSWTTDGSVHYASNLVAGKSYQLIEVSAPEGYALALPISFTVDDDGQDQSVTLVNKRILISKVDTAVEQLAGAKLEVRDADGNVVDSWVSDGTAHPVSGLKVGGTYTLVETEAPEGYAIASPVIFTVSEEAEDEELSLMNKQVLVTKTDITGENELPGATLSVWLKTENSVEGVDDSTEPTEPANPEDSTESAEMPETETDGSGETAAPAGTEAVDRWVSGTEAHAISHIEVGKTYILREEIPAKGYTTANEIEFTVNDDFKNQQIIMKDDVTKLLISKQDITTGGELPGATLEIIDKDGNVVDSWVSDVRPHYIEMLPIGTYTLKETNTPAGYITAEAIPFEVRDTAEIQKVEMVDHISKLEITKTDITGSNPVIGAELTIRNSDGQELYRWVTGEEPYYIEMLPVGTYTLTEVYAPGGYATAESITFEVMDTAEMQKINMKDDVTKLEITKTDLTNGKQVIGAELVLKDLEGNEIDRWVTAEEPHYIEMLPIGKYTLTETQTPDGYVTAETITFEVADTAEIQHVDMDDDITRLEITKTDITDGKPVIGAELVILDKDGNEIHKWTTGEKPQYIEMLPAGEYVLKETTAPDGYVTAEEIAFTVADTGEIQKVNMDDDVTRVEISKTDITDGKPLIGAELIITDKDGNEIDRWITTEEPHYIEKLPVGTYTLKEVSAPDGYATAETVSFTVADTGEIQKVNMDDDVIKVSITKTDLTDGKPVIGAELVIRDKDGNEMERWITTEEPHYIEKLPTGKYTLTELQAPDGYATAETVEFEVKDTGEIQHVKMEDAPIQVSISKKDITNDEELPGAKLVVKDKDGNKVEEWISTDEPHMLNLNPGDYTLTEITAPDGYEVAETIEFTVKDTGEIQHVTMYDSPREDTVDLTGKKDEKTKTTSNGGGGSVSGSTPVVGNSTVTASPVQTGDSNRYIPAIILIVGGVCVLAALTVYKRKKKNNNK